MRVRFKLPRKSYVKLISNISNYDYEQFININKIDKLNLRKLFIDAMLLHERWRNDKDYHQAKKNNALSLEVNHFGTLQKVLNQLQLSGEHNEASNLLLIISIQVIKQIDSQIIINQQLNS